MDKVSFIKVDDINGNPLDFAVIDKGEGAYTSMLKSDYDRLQVAQAANSGSSVPNDPLAPTAKVTA